MKLYEPAKMTVIHIEICDIITTSSSLTLGGEQDVGSIFAVGWNWEE